MISTGAASSSDEEAFGKADQKNRDFGAAAASNSDKLLRIEEEEIKIDSPERSRKESDVPMYE